VHHPAGVHPGDDTGQHRTEDLHLRQPQGPAPGDELIEGRPVDPLHRQVRRRRVGGVLTQPHHPVGTGHPQGDPLGVQAAGHLLGGTSGAHRLDGGDARPAAVGLVHHGAGADAEPVPDAPATEASGIAILQGNLDHAVGHRPEHRPT
jgi:hypothetical protein